MQLWKRRYDEQDESKLIQETHPKYEEGKRVVVVLPGRDVFDVPTRRKVQMAENPEPLLRTAQVLMTEVAGCVKGAERLLGGRDIYDHGVEVYCMTHSTVMDEREIVHHYEKPETYFGNDAKQFVDYYLLPLLNKDGAVQKLSEHLSVDELEHRLNHITFVGHSLGSIFAQEACNALRDRLGREGYSEPDVDRLTQALVTVSVANTARTDIQRPGMVTYSFCATNDPTAKNAITRRASMVGMSPEDMLQKTGYRGRPDGKLKLGKASNGVVVTGKVPDHVEWVEHKKDACVLRVWNDEEREKQGVNMDVHHDFRIHSIPGMDQQMYAHMLRRAALNCVNRDGPVKDVHELLTSPPKEIVEEPILDYCVGPNCQKQMEGLLAARKARQEGLGSDGGQAR